MQQTLRKIVEAAHEEVNRLSTLLQAVEPHTLLDRAKTLAVHLHTTFCRLGHTESCDWFYEVDYHKPGGIKDGEGDLWDEHAHKKALDYAKSLLQGKAVDVWF